MQVSALHFGCSGCGVPLRGRLAPQLGQLQALQQLHLAGNELGGQLPAEWGEPGAFPCLLELDLSSNNVAGSVPDQWTAGATFLKLTVLQARRRATGAPRGAAARMRQRRQRRQQQDCWALACGIH